MWSEFFVWMIFNKFKFMRKLKIAILAPVEEEVPPKKYGGTELVVYNLIESAPREAECLQLVQIQPA